MADPNDGQVVTEAWEAYVSQDPVDNVFARHWLLEQLRSNSSFEKQNGRAIFHILEYALNNTVKFMSEYEELDVTAQTTFDQCEFAWKNLGGDVPMSEFEKAITAAGAGKFDLMSKKIDNLKSTMEEVANTACFADGTGTSGKEFGGLQYLVSSTPTTGTVGQINRATFSFYRNQQTSGAKTTTAYDNLKSTATTIYNNCSNGIGKENPTFAVTTQTVFQGFESLLTTQERYDRQGTGDLGVSGFKGQKIQFKDIPLAYDAACPSGNMYILNNRNLHLVYALWMKGYPPASPANQFADVFKVLTIANLSTDNPRRLGVITAIT
jgi:hypothetical protein